MKEVWWWRQTGVGPFPARQPPPSQEKQEGGLCAGGALPDPRAGRLRARQHSQSPAGEWWWSPFFRVRKLISEPRHAAAGARLHVRIISQLHGSGRMVARQPRNHACGNAWRWEKLYHQTLTNAFLKKLHRDCQCLDFCP